VPQSLLVSAPTPLERTAAGLVPGRAVWLKREDLHETGVFKWRATLAVLDAYRARGDSAVVTASTGNHGSATAWAARELGMRAVVFVPVGASARKLELLASFGADVRAVGDDLDEAKEAGAAFAAREGLPFFEDGGEPLQYDAYEAIGAEIVGQLTGPPGAVVVPVGNGALLIGVARALRRLSPSVHVVGAVAAGAPVMALSWDAGRPVECSSCDTFADGLAVRVAIPRAVEEIDALGVEMVTVTEPEIARAVGSYATAGVHAEGAAGAALAAAVRLSDSLADPLVLVVTGRNIDPALHALAVADPDSF
jgi:threonine dehydratase